MILVLLGTQNNSFYRLLEEVQKCIDEDIIKDKVIVQAGSCSDFKSKKMKIFDLIPMDEYENLISKCDILITHGGVGSIISGLNKNKKVIAAARLSKYKEHTNDHQLQIIENFKDAGYILSLDDFEHLDLVLDKIKSFKPKKYKSNNKKFVKLIDSEINKYLGV